MNRVPCKWVVFENSNIANDECYEEDLDDFPTFSVENIERLAELMVGTYRAKSTDQWTAGSGITTKIPPLWNGQRLGPSVRS